MNIKQYIIFLLFTVTFSLKVAAQKDTVFWFAAPAITNEHSGSSGCSYYGSNKCGASPVSLTITNANDIPAYVNISIPANSQSIINPGGFPTIYDTILSNSAKRIELWANDPSARNRMLIETRPPFGDVQAPLDKGLKISCSNKIGINASYEIEETNNSDVFPLKGENGLGDEFYCVFQTTANNQNFSTFNAYSSINIVATDVNKTYIYVDPPDHTGVLGWSDGEPFWIILEKGQTIALLPGKKSGNNPNDDNQFFRQFDKRLSGTYIRAYRDTVNKVPARIGVTLCDDSVFDRDNQRGCYDIVGDQTVPINKVLPNGRKEEMIGSEYIVMRGDLNGDNGNGTIDNRDDWDRIYIVGTKANTNINIREYRANGSTIKNTNITIQAGEHYKYEVTYLANIDAPQYIGLTSQTSTPYYVLHTSGAGGGCEIGGAILPAVSKCTGSKFVGFSRGYQNNKDFLINVMFREITTNDPENVRGSFKIKYTDEQSGGIVEATMQASNFKKIDGTTWWAAQFTQYNVREFTAATVWNENPNAMFHLGTMNGGSSNGGNYGYFSNYGSVYAASMVVETEGSADKVCMGDKVHLVATSDGGDYYEWIPPKYLDDPNIPNPVCTPREPVIYNVVVHNTICNLTDTSEIEIKVSDSATAHFVLDKVDFCAPDSVFADNLSTGIESYKWHLDGSEVMSGKGAPEKLPMFFKNNTDSIQRHEIILLNNIGYCFKSAKKIVEVYPEVKANIGLDTNMGCHPLTVRFQDSTVGIIDSMRYYWDFGDLQTSIDQNPVHTYKNINNPDDTTYSMKLVVVSPFICSDSIDTNITVHPYISTDFSADSTQACNSIDVNIEPENSIGVDTFYWSFTDHFDNIDTSFIHLNSTTFRYKRDNTSFLTPDTINVEAIGLNRFGCADTASPRDLIIYPPVNSDFTPSAYEVCDSTPVTFTNNSTQSPIISYKWDYGDNNSLNIKNTNDVANTYYNKVDSLRIAPIRLISYNTYICTDTAYDTIVVHPYIRAGFNMEYNTYCPPFNANISNQSKFAKTYRWDMGDGSPKRNDSLNFVYRFDNSDHVNQIKTNVKLVVSNHGGCTDSISKPLTIQPKIYAEFNTDTNGGCQPIRVNFNRTSPSGPITYYWNLGNENIFTDTANLTNFAEEYYNFTKTDTQYIVSLRAKHNLSVCDSVVYDTIEAYSYIDANINVNRLDSCSPFVPEFSSGSIGNINSLLWEFSDSTTSSLANPLPKVFSNPATFGVTPSTKYDSVFLTTWNKRGCSDKDTSILTVYPELQVSFSSPGDQFDCHPTIREYENRTHNQYAKDGILYTWKFGDGRITYDSLGLDMTNRFENVSSADKTFTISLYGETLHGCTDSSSSTQTVARKIEAGFTTDEVGVCYRDSVEFINNSVGATNFDWYDLDNVTQFSPTWKVNPGNQFKTNWQHEQAKDKKITLIASYRNKCRDTAVHYVELFPKIDSRISYTNNDSAGCHPFNIKLKNLVFAAGSPTSAPDQYKYEWDFSESGTTNDTSFSVQRTFYNSTNVTQKQQVYVDVRSLRTGCTASDTSYVFIYPNPISKFELDSTFQGCSPHPIRATNLSTEVADPTNHTYTWLFGDGITKTQYTKDTISYNYINENAKLLTYDLWLESTTDEGCRDTAKTIVTVYPQVTARFNLPFYEICSPFNFQPQDSSENADFYEWYIDDDYFRNSKTFNQTLLENKFDSTITHNIKLIVFSEDGCYDSVTKPINIHSQPKASFEVDPYTQEFKSPSVKVTITNKTTHFNSYNYEWYFGDSTSVVYDIVNPTHYYGFWPDNPERKFNIFMKVFNDHCWDSTSRNILIYPPSPEPYFSTGIDGCEPLMVTLVDSSRYGYKHVWNFGDDSEPLIIELTDTAEIKYPLNRVVTHTFPETDPHRQEYYNVSLDVYGDGGAQSFRRVLQSFPKPEIEFEVSPDTILLHDVIKTYNNTIWVNKGGGDVDQTQYSWFVRSEEDDNFLLTSEEKEPSFKIDEVIGSLDFLLVATTEKGCTDSLWKEANVLVLGEGEIEFPNAFVPIINAEGDRQSGKVSVSQTEEPANEFFYPSYENVETYKLEIYDRWGQIIFLSEDINIGWNGYIKGKLAPQDVYVYRCVGSFFNGMPFARKGDLTLLHGYIQK
ncbi:gliding motility-associated C-terminal domain-containing protein [Bacteroidales bacterium]|nr:gliding motility-associated C-terminal domain-containing protein [Bacteroidales bacterium]